MSREQTSSASSVGQVLLGDSSAVTLKAHDERVAGLGAGHASDFHRLGDITVA